MITAENAADRLTMHVATVVGQYAGKLDSWDVVNEAIDLGEPDGLRATPWRHLIGPDFIQLAFDAAATADPTTRLVYNEYALVETSAHADAKRQAALRLLQELLARRTGACGGSAMPPRGGRWHRLRADRLAPAGIAARDAAVAATYRAFVD